MQRIIKPSPVRVDAFELSLRSFMKRPRRSMVSIVLVVAAGTAATTGLLYGLPQWLRGRVDAKASDYKLPEGNLHFDALKPASAKGWTDRNERRLGYLPTGTRLSFYRPLSDIDPKVVEYVVLLEDAKFWHHDGFDIEQIKNSISANFESGRAKRGGSTITQQLAKNLFLDRKKSLTRKIYEIPWAMRLERDLSKKQLLELYLNAIEWGPGIYGVEAAARHFFDSSAKELSVGQAMYLALIVPNPVRFDLNVHPRYRDFLEKKKKAFVQRLVSEKKIPADQRDAYLSADFGLAPLETAGRNYPVKPKIAAWLGEIFRAPGAAPLKKEWTELTIDSDTQRELEGLAEIAVPGTPPRWIVVLEGSEIRAIRKLAAGRGILEDPTLAAARFPLLPEAKLEIRKSLSTSELID